MGYTTDFIGRFKLDRKLDDETLKLLKGLANTRRMKRRVDEKKYGVEGEFYIDGDGDFGQDVDATVIDQNEPPKTQPGLWCQWIPTGNGQYIEWDGNEKFYNYVEWLEYLIDRILKPRGYALNGCVAWQGEEFTDRGTIDVVNNRVVVNEDEVKHTTFDNEGEEKTDDEKLEDYLAGTNPKDILKKLSKKAKAELLKAASNTKLMILLVVAVAVIALMIRLG